MNRQPTFRINDRVECIDENLSGKIVKISGDKITFVDDEAFEWEKNADELILQADFDPGTITEWVKKKKEGFKQRFSKLEKKSLPEVDLHREKVPERYFYNRTILEGQLKFLLDKLEFFKRKNIIKFRIIHGKGSGKLKAEIQKLLRRKGYRTNEEVYQGGSAIVEKI